MFAHAQDWKEQPTSHWNLVNIVSLERKRQNNCRGSKIFQQMMHVRANEESFRETHHVHSNVSATMFPCLWGPLHSS